MRHFHINSKLGITLELLSIKMDLHVLSLTRADSVLSSATIHGAEFNIRNCFTGV